MDQADIENRFAYHAPAIEERKAEHASVRSHCLFTAERFNELLPEGREKSTAITKLEEAMFWGNAALARQDEG